MFSALNQVTGGEARRVYQAEEQQAVGGAAAGRISSQWPSRTKVVSDACSITART